MKIWIHINIYVYIQASRKDISNKKRKVVIVCCAFVLLCVPWWSGHGLVCSYIHKRLKGDGHREWSRGENSNCHLSIYTVERERDKKLFGIVNKVEDEETRPALNSLRWGARRRQSRCSQFHPGRHIYIQSPLRCWCVCVCTHPYKRDERLV